MKKCCATVLVLALGLATGISATPRWVPLEPGKPESPGRFQVLSSTPQRTVVELELSGLYIEDVTAQGRQFQTLELGMKAGGLLTEVGSPALPVLARFIAIPDDRAVDVNILEQDEVALTGYNIYPAQPPLPENQSSQPFVIDEKRYGRDEFYPALSYRVSDPMIMRDFRLVQLVLQPARFNPVTGELRICRRLVLELRYDRPSQTNVKLRHRTAISRAFEPLYKEFIANYDFVRPPQRAEDGSYLIITHDDFASAVGPFAAWKRRKGWRTVVVTTSQIGGNDSAHIDAYIANAYNNWPYPPDYVLLVGDAPTYLRCCHWPGQTDASDLKYSLQEGSDILADLMISRACVQTLTEAQTVMNKLYKYESDPYLANTQWFNKVCALAGYEGSPRFWSVVIRIRNYVMGRPFTQFDTLFQRWGLNTATNLSESLNQGRAWMLYRGHGDVDAWANVTPSWTNSNVYALTNGRMVPAVVAPTCLSGNFDEATDCHAEAWLKAGTPTEEKGGCAYFGSSEVSYSGYNDSLAAGTFFSYVDSLTYTYAQCTQWGKLFMLQAYPLPDEISEEEIYMFNNFGEPELNVWSATPRELTVSHPATVLIGSFLFPVTVMASGNPVANAQVCVMSTVDTTVFHVGHTNASGQIQFNLQTTLPGDTLLVTVTGRNLRPYLASVRTMAPNAAYVTYLKHLINDSAPGGNGDLIINPGETIKLPTWVKNWGAVTANSVTGTLRATDPNITILDSVKSFGNIPAGDSAFTGPAGYRFSVAAACTNGYVLRFTLRCRDALDSVWNSSINLFVGTPVLNYASKTVNDPPPGGNGDGKLDPGETAQLLVTLRNIGLGHGYNVAARLRSGDHRLHALDSLASYGTIPKESTGTNTADPFILHADDSIPREAVISCTLLVTADGGYARTIPFTIVVGEIRTIDPIPDGPRQPPLYWAYDDVDSHYVQHPEFNWVEIRGLGTRLSLGDDETRQVNLPSGFGPWRYYGQSFSQISICSNGWVAAGYTTTTTYTNTSLPNSAMPPMVCMNWDDLYPPSAPSNGGVWHYHDAANHRFIVEFDSVPYFSSRTTFESFELVIYDTTVTTPSGDNLMIAQYLTARGYSSSTVGLQDPSLTVAIQCLFDGSYHRGAAPIAAGRAIKFVTGSPQVGVTENELTGAEIAGLRFLVWPNPSRKGTMVSFSLPNEARVRLAVFDITGRLIRTLVQGEQAAGGYTVTWNGRDDAGRLVPTGTYLYKLETDAGIRVTKSVLVR